MFNFLKQFSSLFRIGADDAQAHERTAETPKTEAIEEPPKIMKFREVDAPSNRVGDIFWLPPRGPNGKKFMAVNFDFEMCGWKGIPKLVLYKDDPSKGKVILRDGTEIEATIELLPKEDTKCEPDETACEEEW